ncbi:MAG: hypothetical protein DMF56_22050 [Acidobacteria bacterium]|nr:MAG: hypothetical protein DMF56_22050 [Acidobacteriota bacterium]
MRADFLRIARMTIALRCDDPGLAWEWPGASSRFLVPPATPDVELDLRAVDAIPPAQVSDLVFDSGAVWRLFRDGEGFRIECHSDVFPANPYKAATFDASFTHGTIVMSEGARGLCPLDYPLDEVLVSHLLGRGRGVELHSCGVIDQQGRGHLFVGMSGAGKSTTARLWGSSAAAILSDDRVIVREEEDGMRMHGTPWHGEAALSMPASAPLAGVYLLEQSSQLALRELHRADAVARLFGCSFPPFHDSESVAFTLAFLERLADRVPVRELRFTRDARVADLILAEAA